MNQALKQSEHFSKSSYTHKIEPKVRKDTAKHSVTELVFTQHSGDEVMLLLPMLAHLCRVADRWITWINPDKVDREQLESFGVDTRKIRLIHCDPETNSHRILKEALQQGSSHTVITSMKVISDSALVELQRAAKQGDSHGLLVRYRDA